MTFDMTKKELRELSTIGAWIFWPALTGFLLLTMGAHPWLVRVGLALLAVAALHAVAVLAMALGAALGRALVWVSDGLANGYHGSQQGHYTVVGM